MALASPAVYAGGSVVTGLGVGLTFNGNLRAISAATTADRRSEVFSAAYLVSYTALGLSSLAAGLAAPVWRLQTTGYAYLGTPLLSVLIRAGRAPPPRRRHGPYDGPGRRPAPPTPRATVPRRPRHRPHPS
ncbi:hypothetical protein [Streptomyces sp. NPDC052015]|uniref:hypothetical protein n=1 Tax=Streptomyces sp. NPDC052015 TaxID=3154755 RepID=UPI0034434391